MKDNFNQERYGCIYQIINIQNNKCYIGQTIKCIDWYVELHFKRAERGDYKGKKYFYDAIRKYGRNNFKYYILGYCDSKKELNDAEIICIEFFQSNNSIYGYNMTKGGDGVSGYKIGIETREKLSKIRKGRIVSKETRIKIGKIRKGKTNSEEHRKNISKSIENSSKFEKHLEELHNEMKGSKWLNNGIQDKLVKAEEIQIYLKNDWVFGRLRGTRVLGIKFGKYKKR